MLETPHVAVGAAIAVKIGNPLLSLPLAFASHFVLERVPHWNPHLNSELDRYGKVTRQSTEIVVVDTLLALFLGFFIAISRSFNIQDFITIILASLFSVLPDVVEGPYFFLNAKNTYVEKWMLFQKSLQENARLIPGILTQIITVIAALCWIYL